MLFKPRFQANEDAASGMLRASRENGHSTQPHKSRNRPLRNHRSSLTGHPLPLATQCFVQETFLIGSAVRKVLSFCSEDDGRPTAHNDQRYIEIDTQAIAR
jgi:hypothetical protein